PGHYFLVGEASGSFGSAIPTADVSGSISMDASSGKVALANTTVAFSSSTPSGANLRDFVGYGTANAYEGPGAAPGLIPPQADFRALGGQGDSDNNGSDFSAGTASARNSSSALNADYPGFASVESVSYSVGEGGGSVVVGVTLNLAVSHTLSVAY